MAPSCSATAGVADAIFQRAATAKGKKTATQSPSNQSEKENLNPNTSHPPVQPTIHDPFLHYHPSIISRYADSIEVNVCQVDPFTTQDLISVRMKRILLDWLFKLQKRFRLQERTLFLAENILMRYIAARSVSKEALQLVGLVSLWIAAKVEDIYPPTLNDLGESIGHRISAQEILRAEQEVLLVLRFDLIFVSAYDVLESIAHSHRIVRKKVLQVAQLVLELQLFTPNIRASNPFELALFATIFAVKLCSSTAHNDLKLRSPGAEYLQRMMNLTRESLLLLKRDSLGGLGAKYGDLYAQVEKACTL